MNSETGKCPPVPVRTGIIGIGVIIILVGVIIYFFHDKLNWIGACPAI
jgi:hypothetical protein